MLIKLVFGLFAFLWTLAVSFFSTDRFSLSKTSRFIEPILHYISPDASPESLYAMHVAIRKLGHLTEYAVFAVLTFSIWAAGEERWRTKWIGYALAMAAMLAVLDEYNQSFTRLRAASPIDSIIDVLGACAALFLIRLIMRRRFETWQRS